MAVYRAIHVDIWREDDWFLELEPDAKVFWFYLLTNPSTAQAGIYRLPLRTMTNESGLPAERVRVLLAQFEQEHKVVWDAAASVIWVVKMREYQTGTVNGRRLSPPQMTGLDNDLRAVPDCTAKRAYQRHYGYPVPDGELTAPTLSIGYAPAAPTLPILEETETETETHSATVGVADPRTSAPATPEPVTVTVPPVPPLEACLAYLRAGEGVNGQPFNPAAAVARLFTLRFGDTYPPNYGRLGRVAGQLSGGYTALAQMIWSAPQVEGDPHDYLTRTAGGASNRRRTSPQATPPAQPAQPDPQLAAFRRQRAQASGGNGNGASGNPDGH